VRLESGMPAEALFRIDRLDEIDPAQDVTVKPA
jgi:hypothetical protein